MKISNISNYSATFCSNTPIYHVYVNRKNGTIEELTQSEVIGPTLGLVKRLNNPNSREAKFLKQYIKDFNEFPLATSCIWDKNSFNRKHIIYGEDALTVDNLRKESFKFNRMSTDEIRDTIQKSIIQPLFKKVRLPRFSGDKVGEQVGLVLYTDEIKPNKYYKLNGIEITNIDGVVHAKLQPEKAVKRTNKKQIKTNETIPEENKPLPQTVKKPKTQKTENLVEEYLFDVTPYEDKPNHWQTENDLKPRKRWRKHN